MYHQIGSHRDRGEGDTKEREQWREGGREGGGGRERRDRGADLQTDVPGVI